jgi:hypothetical protein
MKDKLPLALMMFMGLLGFTYRFLPHPIAVGYNEYLRDTMLRIISLFAMVLGLGNLINHHLHKIRNKAEHWPQSYTTLVSLFISTFIGIFGGTTGHGLIPTHIGGFEFGITTLFQKILVPLQATVFSLLAFFMASAAYRSFRARNLMAGLLLGSAFIVMLGQVPLGAQIWSGLPKLSQWIMAVPNTASKRGIELGVTLGSLATSLKILTGIERNWMGGSR